MPWCSDLGTRRLIRTLEGERIWNAWSAVMVLMAVDKRWADIRDRELERYGTA